MWSPEPLDFFCNGVRVRSAIALGFPLAPADGDAPGVIVERGPVSIPLPGLADDRDADFFVEDGGLILAVRGVGRFKASDGTKVLVDADPEATAADIRLYLSGSVLGAIWLQRGSFPLHASTIRLPDGGCVAFLGPSGAGKSSLAAHFARAGHSLVTDDVSVLTPRDGGFAVWPGPSHVKLAVDALQALERHENSLPRAGGRREKYHLEFDAGSRGLIEPVKLRGMFLLSWGEGMPKAVLLTGLDALDVVAGHTYRQEFVQQLGLTKPWLRQAATVARTVPTFRLIRARGYDRSADVIDAVLAALEAHGKEKRAS